MWLLMVPLLILFVLVIGGVIALPIMGLAWLIGGGWPWLLIGLGLWLFWRGDRRHRGRKHGSATAEWSWTCDQTSVGGKRWERRSRSRQDKTAPKPAPVTPIATAAPAAKVVAVASAPRPAELPVDVQVKVDQIRRKADMLLGYADRFPPFSQDLHLVRQTASEYLPRTIAAYQAMPKQTADKPLPGDGRNAHQELRAQLDLLDSKLDEIAQDLERQDRDRLLANRRFLEDRFGNRNPPQASTDRGQSVA